MRSKLDDNNNRDLIETINQLDDLEELKALLAERETLKQLFRRLRLERDPDFVLRNRIAVLEATSSRKADS